MALQAVCVDGHGGTADGRKVKAAFPFFDEIFHLYLFAATVELEHLIRRQLFQCGNNEGASVYDLSVRFLYLKTTLQG